MVGKKIGNLVDILNKGAFDRYILQGLFEKVSLGGAVNNLQDSFKVDVGDANFIKLETLSDNRFSIQLIERQKNKLKSPNGKPMDLLNTKYTFVIHYKEPDFPVYNSEY